MSEQGTPETMSDEAAMRYDLAVSPTWELLQMLREDIHTVLHPEYLIEELVGRGHSYSVYVAIRRERNMHE